MPPLGDDAGDYLANVRALEAAGAELLAIQGGDDEALVLLGAIAAVTERIKLGMQANPPAALEAIARGRVVIGTPDGERWIDMELPSTRSAWVEAVGNQEAEGTTGVIVPWDPRLIDLLRNPEPDDRSDLLMSTGWDLDADPGLI